MLKIFNFFKTPTGETKSVSMRDRFDAAQEEMNAVLALMSDMPAVRIDPKTRTLEIAAPDQFADEALALPAPEPEAEDTKQTVQDMADEMADAAGTEATSDAKK